MIVSMTGFGKGRTGNKNLNVEVEVKSVNSRYLDISLRIPSSLMNKDYDIKEFIKSKVKRGKVLASIQIKRNGLEEENLALDSDKLKSYLSLLKSIKKAAKISEKVKLEHLLINKEILISNNFLISEVEFNMVKDAIEQALTEMMNMKKKEGKELSKDLRKRIDNIEIRLKEIEKEAEQSVQEYFKKFKEKIKLLIENIAQYSERLELELAIIAEKAEITEECVRLRSHLKFFLNSLENDDEPGRKLNFLCQEMNREANTISSKTVSTSVTHNTVFIREEIEKIREQIQNIEWFLEKKKGKIFAISAPSGTGKTTIVKRVLDEIPDLVYSVSATTRGKRNNEKSGVDYFFITEQEFLDKTKKNEFVEWEKVYDYYYGTFKYFIDENIIAGKSIIAEVDVKGALSLKKIYPEAILIFIAPPSLDELVDRLKKRKTETDTDLVKRTERAKMELSQKDKFDYLIVNKDLEKAISETKSLILTILNKE